MDEMEIHGTPTYRPDSPFRNFEPYTPKKGENYMSPEQAEHFRNILIQLAP